MTSYLKDRAHLLVAGVTGARTDYGGKTAWGTWWADTWGRSEFDVVLFFNAKGDSSPEQYADAVVSHPDEAARAIGAGATFVTISPTTHDWAGVHSELRELVRWLGDRDLETAVVHDEAPEYDGEALQGFVRVDGNGSNCKSVVIAQSPGDLSKGVRKQCILVWVGPATGEETGIFRANQRAAHIAHCKAQEPYHWAVLLGPDKGDRDVFKPVPERYAD